MRFHRLMQDAPHWDRALLDTWVRTQRRRVAMHAIATVPYYRDTWTAAGVSAERLDDEQEWLRVPTLTKRDVVDAQDRMISTAAGRDAVWTSTSGSTGMPMRIMLDSNINAAAFALFWRAWSTGGYWRLGQRQAVMKGQLAAGLLHHNRKLRALETVAARVNATTVREVRAALAAYRPRFMRGYPSALYLFCRVLEEQGLKLEIPMVISGSETLHDYHRNTIESVLGARVFNHYTHWERSASVLECEHGSLHAQQDFGYHELLDRDGQPVGPGIEGEITVTGLHNSAMPFIRYRTGDIGVWAAQPCACGGSFPVIERIVGRDADFLIRRDGALLGGLAVTQFMKNLTDVQYVQLVQHQAGAVIVKVVKAATYSELTSRRIIRELELMFDGQMDLTLEFCAIEELERSPVGKVRQFIRRAKLPLEPAKVAAL